LILEGISLHTHNDIIICREREKGAIGKTGWDGPMDQSVGTV
jgi:hypothetical protein